MQEPQNKVPGPCQFCASIGAACHLDPSRRRQRPYYHVSEEEFRYMTKALEHFLPNVELNLHSLREIVQSFDATVSESRPESGSEPGSGSGPTASTAVPQLLPTGASELSYVPSSSDTSSDSAVVVTRDDSRTTPASTTDTMKSDETVVSIEEIDELHGELGWLRVDSKGTYRHVGADSGYGFHAAVRSLRQRRGSSETSRCDLVPPFTVAPPLPPSTPDSSAGVPSPHFPSQRPAHNARRMQIFLPRRDLCNRCVSRFFRDIQSIYWFWSAERFYAMLDRLYAGDPASATPSMLCSLYAILALTCESEAQAAMGELDPAAAAAQPKRWFLHSVTKRIQTVSMFSNTAYVYIALCYGNPPAISEEHAASKLQDLSEQILSPGSYMPLDYLTVSGELVQIKRHLSKLLYARAAPAMSPSATASRPSITAVTDVLSTLRNWYSAIPPHLRDVSQAASFHQRSVSVLHLRYWSAMIFATRPFLLYSVLHADSLAMLPVQKRASFEDFCGICIDAAKSSLAVIEIMRDAGLLSSLVTLDTSCILEVLQVLLLALSRGQTERADDVRACLHMLQGMEQIFWTQHVLTEVMVQMDENGLLNGDRGFSPQGDTPGNFFLDIGQQQQQQDSVISGVMEAYFSDLHDPFFVLQEESASMSMIGSHYQDTMAQQACTLSM
ncbi:aldehyde dehydrogenase [Niveomyces insectorum RCEF 264]|uniref:Aldehyde dehydrogenase n=1 Tax=Niveomyces insectorum RCEF 264 TaxID=1081102 RepID=A0A167PWT7_9HYPO|nr:aldehyde dehydrogenase [Niveomyces insectorum RCEF 264]